MARFAMKIPHITITGLLCLCVALCAPNLTRAERLILSKDGIDISFEEAFTYSVKHTNSGAYEVSMSKPLATHRVLQNLYVLKRIDQLVTDTGIIPPSERQYLENDIRRRISLERYLDKVISERMAEIDWDGLAEAEYAQKKSELKSSEEVRVEHILVSIESLPFEAFVSKVIAVQEALARGADFAKLIAAYSDDPSAERNGGDLGFFTRQRMQPTFADAAFGLQDYGEITGPVMTRFGAHFIRFLDRRDPETLPFDRVKRALIKEIKKSTESALREEFLGVFRDEIRPELAEVSEPDLLQEFLRAYEQLETAGDVIRD